jgi:hypothetical protein
VKTVIERKHDAASRKGALSEATNRFRQRQYSVTAVTNDLEPPAQESWRHEQLWIPLVLVLERNPMIAKDKQPPAPPV